MNLKQICFKLVRFMVIFLRIITRCPACVTRVVLRLWCECHPLYIERPLVVK